MFTGIIEEIGTVLEARGDLVIVGSKRILDDCKRGDSIAVNGVDLTVCDITSTSFSANVMPETCRRSNLSSLVAGASVNLERSLRPVDRISGHLVRGVIEGTGAIVAYESDGSALIMSCECGPELLQHVVLKGPVAVDGVSLTTVKVSRNGFSVSLVEYTRENTTLEQKGVGEIVNIETDIIARYVHRILNESSLDNGALG
ncbi:MAG: riboflavin synthase [Acidimicrobiales bacterium]